MAASCVNVVLSIHSTTVGIFHRIEKNTGHSLPDVSCALVVLGFFLAVAAVTLTPIRGVSWRWLTWAGILTYPLYLIHEYWGLWLVQELRPHLAAGWTLLAAVLFVLALAWVMHLVAERPFRKRLFRAVERSFPASIRSAS